jgi:hypothetical protein
LRLDLGFGILVCGVAVGGGVFSAGNHIMGAVLMAGFGIIGLIFSFAPDKRNDVLEDID